MRRSHPPEEDAFYENEYAQKVANLVMIDDNLSCSGPITRSQIYQLP